MVWGWQVLAPLENIFKYTTVHLMVIDKDISKSINILTLFIKSPHTNPQTLGGELAAVLRAY